MASKKSNGGRKAVGLAATVVTVVPVVAPLVEKAIDDITTQLSHKSKLVTIPPLYDKGFPIKLDAAVESLKIAGLKPIPSKLDIKEADAKYRDCFVLQVVSSNPEHKQKTPAGSGVIIKYITQEVIDESQKIFEELERQKAEDKRLKAEKREQQIEQVQKIVSDAASSAKDGVSKIFPHRKHKDYRDTESDR